MKPLDYGISIQTYYNLILMKKLLAQVNMKSILLSAFSSLLTIVALPAIAEDCREERAVSGSLGMLVGTLFTTCNYLDSGWIKEEFEEDRLEYLRKTFTRLNDTKEVSNETKRKIFGQLDNTTFSKCAELIQELDYDK